VSDAADRDATLLLRAGVPVKVACRPGWLNTLLAVTEPAGFTRKVTLHLQQHTTGMLGLTWQCASQLLLRIAKDASLLLDPRLPGGRFAWISLGHQELNTQVAPSGN
jgi:hypothetical protein